MEKLILLDFWADWCGYCTEMDSILEELAEEFRDQLTVKKINFDEDAENAQKYRVMGIPTYVIINAEGEILGRISGFRQKNVLQAFIQSCLEKTEPPL